jgi:hypothetical protein
MIYLLRTEMTESYTSGSLYVDGKFQCYTLERALTDPEHPAIPIGIYTCYPFDSPHFKMKVLRLVNVPERTDIEVHAGNTTADSKGCILVGKQKAGPGVLMYSRDALRELITLVPMTTTITITDHKEE